MKGENLDITITIVLRQLRIHHTTFFKIRYCIDQPFLLELKRRAKMGSKGRSHEKKTAVLLDFVQIASSPPLPLNLDNLYNFFRRQSSRFESQFKTKKTIYTL